MPLQKSVQFLSVQFLKCTAFKNLLIKCTTKLNSKSSSKFDLLKNTLVKFNVSIIFVWYYIDMFDIPSSELFPHSVINREQYFSDNFINKCC